MPGMSGIAGAAGAAQLGAAHDGAHAAGAQQPPQACVSHAAAATIELLINAVAINFNMMLSFSC